MIASGLSQSQIKLKPSTTEEEEDENEEEEEEEGRRRRRRRRSQDYRFRIWAAIIQFLVFPFGANKTGGNDLSTPKPNPKP